MGEGIRLSARIIRWSVWSRAMVAAFVFNDTVHEWGHEYSNRGRAGSFIRDWNSWMVGVEDDQRIGKRISGWRVGGRGNPLIR